MKLILLMLLGHLIADYTLQGWLSDGKQKKWWDKICGGKVLPKYRYDYVAALVCHALYWSIVTFLPLYGSPLWSFVVIVNTVIHAVVDDLKANRNAISLCHDQLLHLAQIVTTYFVLMAA
jgi:hypothetical protein